ncbi:helix-turn-helix transcriptional regulator [Eisenibacter elegans]|jgi:predicted DNA-binding transcriptional regulator YafY|uniref:helix-turn-helix transcriptional regulator n=1 Tax=Eisenibacter elegans TaxID=997 RepID=UPI000478E7F3|nr:WYL domain-containing protein [Eisenibacter elegans]
MIQRDNREQWRIKRVFELIQMLVEKPPKTVKQLAANLSATYRTIYRDLILLEELGYPIEKDFYDRYFIVDDLDGTVKSSFSPQEALLLQELIKSAVEAQHPLKEPILKKLYHHSIFRPMANTLLRSQQIVRNINTLIDAITHHRQVLLKNYHSVKSQHISNKLVEPLAFTPNYQRLSAYDPEAGIVKVFKPSRLQQVTLLDTARSYTGEALPPDVFGMVGNPFEVVLALSDRAYRLMIEEYPETQIYIAHHPEGYLAKIPVQDERGIGRFVLGLLGEIKIIAPPHFKAYLQQRLKNTDL